MNSKKIVKFLTGLFAAVLMLASCGANKGNDNKTLRMVATTPSNSLNNLVTSEAPNFLIISNYMEGLATYDQSGKLVGSLAKDWEISKDGLTYTFHLRDGLKWSNEDPITAKDFVFGWRTLGQKADAAYANMLADVKGGKALLDKTGKAEDLGVVAKDDKTLVVTLEQPRAYFADLMAFAPFFPLNEKFYNEVGEEAYGTSAETVLASGPFVLTKYNPTLEYVLEKNPNYWNAENVALDKVVTRVVEQLSTQASMYDNNEIDRLALSSDLMDQYSDSADLVTQDESAVFYMFLSNTTGRADSDKLLGNKNFRKAIAYSMDKEKLGTNVLKNGSKGIDYLVPTHFAELNGQTFREFSGKHNDPIYNPEKAKEYLEAAKAELGDTPLNFELTVSETETGRKAFEYIQAQIQDNLPGVTVSLNFIPSQQYFKTLEEGKTTAAQAGWGADFVDVATYFSIFRSFDDHNYGRYNNPEFDRLVAEAENQATPEDRWKMFAQAEDLLIDDASIIPLFQRGSSALIKPNVKGLRINATSPDFFFKYVSKE